MLGSAQVAAPASLRKEFTAPGKYSEAAGLPASSRDEDKEYP